MYQKHKFTPRKLSIIKITPPLLSFLNIYLILYSLYYFCIKIRITHIPIHKKVLVKTI